jgi:hypothetical protein
LTFSAVVVNHSSFLKLDFLSPVPVVSAFPTQMPFKQLPASTTTQPTAQPVFSLQASCHGRPFASLAFKFGDQMSESPEGAITTANAHKHATVMSNLNISVDDGLHKDADGRIGDGNIQVGLEDDALCHAHFTLHGGAYCQLMTVDVKTDTFVSNMGATVALPHGGADAQVTSDIDKGGVVSDTTRHSGGAVTTNLDVRLPDDDASAGVTVLLHGGADTQMSIPVNVAEVDDGDSERSKALLLLLDSIDLDLEARIVL